MSSQSSSSHDESKHIEDEEDEEDDVVDKAIKKTGCLEKHYAVQECMAEHQDWRKCQEQVRNMFCKETWKMIAQIGLPTVAITATAMDHIGFVASVDGVSMQPTLNPVNGITDYVFINKLACKSIQRGDIVTLTSPTHPKESLIKRVTALEKDKVRTLSYRLHVVKVPEGHCWVEGDNPRKSIDSNTFGPVPLGLVNSKATHIVWPPSRWRRLHTNEPSPQRFEFRNFREPV